MPEQTYGWYPSAKNVYEDRRIGALTPYQKEALYRYRDSKYYAPPVTPPEQKSRPSPSLARRPGSSTSSTSKCSGNNLTMRAKSAPIHTHYKPPPRLNLPTPAQCWSTHVPETEITVPQQSPAPSNRVSAPLPRASPQYPHTQSAVHVQTPTPPPAPPMQKTVRIQSAKFRRDTPTKPQRPVKSAGPVRPSPTQSVQEFTYNQPPAPFVQDVHYDTHETYDPYNTQFTEQQYTDRIIWPEPSAPSPTKNLDREPPSSYKASPQRSSAPSPGAKPPSGKRAPLRPKAPSPTKMVAHMTDEEVLREDGCMTPDYTAETQKHGWMMEVHGDPFRLKKVSRRLPYTVRCEEPEIERDPPKVHMENNETFFLNTIPRRPMAFAIDKEWISEMIHKKRMEMQQKHGLNYRYKNFSFVY